LLTLENEGVDLIVIEEVSEDKEGLAVMNRVKKAATETLWIDFLQKPLDITQWYQNRDGRVDE
jgi:hypothetical protein